MTRSIKGNHARKVNLTHDWDRIHGDINKPKAPGIRASSISDNGVIKLALEIGPTMSPTTDLIRQIEKTYGCSGLVAGRVYNRVTELGLIEAVADESKLTTRWQWRIKTGGR